MKAFTNTVVSRAALLDRTGKVIGEVFDPPGSGYFIEVAGCFAANDYPVNISKYRISRSKKNLDKALYEQPVTKHGRVYAFLKECK